MVKFWDKTIIYGSFPTCSVSLAIDLFFAGTPHPINKLLVVTELGWTQMLFQQSRVDDTTCLGTMFGMQLELKTHYKFIFHVYYILENEIIRISSGVANLLCPDTFNLCPHRQLVVCFECAPDMDIRKHFCAGKLLGAKSKKQLWMNQLVLSYNRSFWSFFEISIWQNSRLQDNW